MADSSEAWKESLSPQPARATEDPLCERCRQAKKAPGTVTVSTRAYDIIEAVVQAAIALGASQREDAIMSLGDEQQFLTVCRDTLYRYIEKIEKRAGLTRESETTTLRF